MTRFNSTDEAALGGTEKALKAWEARKLGATLDQAAKVAGYANRGAAHNAIASLKKGMQMEAAAEMVELENERLDYYLFNLKTKIAAGDVQAINAAINISARRGKLLGLDDFERRMAELNERKMALQERDAAAVAGLLAGVINQLELPPEKLELAKHLVVSGLKELGSSPDVIQGELEANQ